jgi:uncharacterized protein (DUF1800 family)
MMKLLTRGSHGRRFAASAIALAVVTCGGPAAAVQPGATHGQHFRHRVATADERAASEREQSILDADDARFFLTRVGFAPDSAELAQYVGLTRAQAVDKVLASTRTEALTPLPDWVLEPIPTRETRKAWTDDRRREAQRLRGQRYELLHYARGGCARC